MNKHILFLLIIISGCKKIAPPPEEYSHRHFWKDAALVMKVDYVSDSGGELIFDMHVVAMKSDKTDHFFPFSSLYPVSGFSLSTTVSPDTMSLSIKNENLPFQTVLLIDETTEDWSMVTESFIDAANRMNKLCDESKNQYFGIGYYARDEYYGQSPVNFLRNPQSGSLFDHTQEDVMQFLVDNHYHTAIPQNSSLLDAINVTADELIAEPITANRSITVMMGALEDGTSSISYTDLIQKCKDNGIRVNLIIQGQHSFSLYRLALETGGFISENVGTSFSGYYFHTSETPLYHLIDLLSGNYKEYIIRCKATRTSIWGSGSTFTGYIELNYQLEQNNIYFDENLYDDFDFNQTLPVWVIAQ